MSRSCRRSAVLLLLLLPGAVVVGATAACGTFDSADPPAANADASTEAQPADEAGGDALPEATAPDAGATGCRGPFQPPRTIGTADSGIGKSLRSVRGVANGTFLISYDTSPDDDMATAKIPPSGDLALIAPDLLSALNGSYDETAPTAPSDLSFVVFSSNRPPVLDGGAGLWVSEFGGGFNTPALLTVAGLDASVVTQIKNPYLVDNRLFFDVDNKLQSGELVKLTKKVSLVVNVPGLATGTHPVVTKDQDEIFFAGGTGIQRATRAGGAMFAEQGAVDGTVGGDYPTWVSDDGCHLYAIHDNAGAELRVFDRAP